MVSVAKLRPSPISTMLDWAINSINCPPYPPSAWPFAHHAICPSSHPWVQPLACLVIYPSSHLPVRPSVHQAISPSSHLEYFLNIHQWNSNLAHTLIISYLPKFWSQKVFLTAWQPITAVDSNPLSIYQWLIGEAHQKFIFYRQKLLENLTKCI